MGGIEIENMIKAKPNEVKVTKVFKKRPNYFATKTWGGALAKELQMGSQLPLLLSLAISHVHCVILLLGYAQLIGGEGFNRGALRDHTGLQKAIEVITSRPARRSWSWRGP